MLYRIVENKTFIKGNLRSTKFEVQEYSSLFFGLMKFWKTVTYKKNNSKEEKWSNAIFEHLPDAVKLKSLLQKKEPFTGTIKKVLDEK